MGLRIKKTDVLTVDEFKETEKAYDDVLLKIDKEVYDKFTEEYGSALFNVNGDGNVNLDGYTIEFNEKAIRIFGAYNCDFVPYSFIDSVECVYYIEK